MLQNAFRRGVLVIYSLSGKSSLCLRPEEKEITMKRFHFPRRLLAATAAVLLLAFFAHAGTEKVLHAFNIADGELPYDGVVFDNAGNLYGTTFYGGSTDCDGAGCGVVFKLTPRADGEWTESAIYTFTGGADGSHPYSPLIFDAAGNLYGGTFGTYNGGSGFGTVFKLTPAPDGSWKFALLHTFTGGKDGAQPNGRLTFDRAGNLYGATFTGGTYNLGTVFELTPTSGGSRWQETVLHAFTGGKDGSYLSDGVLKFNGGVYGTTEQGGTGCGQLGCGVIFELSPAASGGWRETVLHYFTNGPDGAGPLGLVFDSSGNLYGAAGGGNSIYCYGGCGLVFRLSRQPGGAWKETTLHAFNGGNGLDPSALLFGSDGNLYGAAGSGGFGLGLIFELDSQADWAETVLYKFGGGIDGGEPVRPLIFDAAGNLYGTGTYGGSGNVGVVFEVTP